jgi:predicted RNA binding protein YcfA (HicA-like mRNA interferase family)
MKLVTSKEMCRVLERRGWILRRINGAHHIYNRQQMATTQPS